MSGVVNTGGEIYLLEFLYKRTRTLTDSGELERIGCINDINKRLQLKLSILAGPVPHSECILERCLRLGTSLLENSTYNIRKKKKQM